MMRFSMAVFIIVLLSLTTNMIMAEEPPNNALKATSRTQYLHSNDSLSIKLSEEQTALFGRTGELVTFTFEVTNRGAGGQFYLTQRSEDNFQGDLSPSDSFYLDNGGVKEVRVYDMQIPRAQEGSKLVYALTVTRATGRSRRQSGLRPPGGSGNFEGDPTRSTEATVTLLFTVTDEPIEDDSAPSAWVSYYGQGNEETCQVSSDDPNCLYEYWWSRVTANDDESGLRGFQLRPILDEEAIQDQRVRERLFYRHLNFPVGSDQEQEVNVGGNCCLKGIEVIAKDVAGNEHNLEIWNGDEGSFVGSLIFWIIIIVVAVIVVAGAVVGGVFVFKKKYNAVPSNA